jgi:hypothetical protein
MLSSPPLAIVEVFNVIKFKHLASGIDAIVLAEDCDGNNDQAVG